MAPPKLQACTAREADGTPTLSAEEDEELVRTAPAVSLFVGDCGVGVGGERGNLYVTNRRAFLCAFLF